MAEATLIEFIEGKLSINGFAMEEIPQGIKAWPRGDSPETANFIISQRGEEFVAIKGEGAYSRKKTIAAINTYLKQWSVMYQAGAR